MKRPFTLAGLTLAAALALTACGDADTGGEDSPATVSASAETTASPSASNAHQGMGDSGHQHNPDGGPAPGGIVDASDPTYPVGTKVVLTANHMAGMEGAEATIESSTEETVYMVDVEANGMKMTNHKWVVESEVQPAE